LGQGGIQGYQMGTSAENRVKKFINKKYFDNLSKALTDDFNSRFASPQSYTYDDGYTASIGLEGPHTHWFSLGTGKPEYSYELYTYPKDFNYGEKVQIIMRIKGEMYSDYNWIQTYYDYNKNEWFADQPMNSFYYTKTMIEYFGNGFFEDSPNLTRFSANLTLCGRRGNLWAAIHTFSWGYLPNSYGIFKGYLSLNNFPFGFHQNTILSTLRY
jgi:hypothetical protein